MTVKLLPGFLFPCRLDLVSNPRLLIHRWLLAGNLNGLKRFLVPAAKQVGRQASGHCHVPVVVHCDASVPSQVHGVETAMQSQVQGGRQQ